MQMSLNCMYAWLVYLYVTKNVDPMPTMTDIKTKYNIYIRTAFFIRLKKTAMFFLLCYVGRRVRDD